jgi:hypothetical protein
MIWSKVDFKGKVLADTAEALIGAAYLSAAAEAGLLPPGVGRGGAGAAVGACPLDPRGLERAEQMCIALGVLPPGSRLGVSKGVLAWTRWFWQL